MSNRQSNGRFAPGVSGNPGGRPRSSLEMQLRAQRYAGDALDVLASIMRAKKAPAAARIAAARELLDRGYGRSKQTVDMQPESIFDSISSADLEILIEALEAATEEGR